jgi:site-specific DNA-cytosine methylase
MDWDNPSHTVIAGGKGVQGGWMSVADPRTSMNRGKGDNYLTGGHYGVIPWESPSGAVSSSAGLDNGRWSVADRRVDEMLPAADKKLITVIRALDGTWHRPFTTLELAALQSLFDPEEHWSPDPAIQAQIRAAGNLSGFSLDGNNDSDWRERIGNAVPPAAAEAIAGVMGVTLLLAWSGETFMLSSMPVWVQPIAIAIAVARVDTDVAHEREIARVA